MWRSLLVALAERLADRVVTRDLKMKLRNWNTSIHSTALDADSAVTKIL